jgi:hypothetical protein
MKTVSGAVGLFFAALWLQAAAPVEAGTALARSTPDWHLTYRSVLRANGVGRRDWLAKWLRSHKGAPVRQLLDKWPPGEITSAVLLDVPAFHAAERVVHWLVRAEVGAHAWEYVDGEVQEAAGKSIDPKLYDQLIEAIWDWEQAPPLPEARSGEEVPPGYFGFLSLYRAGRSRQMLLTVEDFYVPKAAGWEDAVDGRVLVTFGPLMESHE